MSYERRKTKVGKVVSSKMDKTLVVSVEWRSPHRVYKKNVRKWSRFKVHDENNIGNLGDTVLITESKPYSKTKKWKLSEILQKGDVADLQPTDIAVNGFDDSGKEVSLEITEEPVSEEEVIEEPVAEEEVIEESASDEEVIEEPVAEEEVTEESASDEEESGTK